MLAGSLTALLFWPMSAASARVGVILRLLAKSLGQGQLLYRFLNQLLYAPKGEHLVGHDERKRLTFALCASRAPYAVNIILCVARNVEVNHHVNVGNVYSAGYYVRRHEYLHVPIPKLTQYLLTLSLFQVGMDNARAKSAPPQRMPKLFHALLSRPEDDDAHPRMSFQYVHHERPLLRLVYGA